MLRGVKVEMKGAKQRMVERADEKLGSVMSDVQEMMKEMMKGFFGEGAVGGRPTGYCDGPGAVKKGTEQMEKSVSEESGMVVVNEEKKEKVQNRDRSKQKGKKGVESMERAKGNKISKDGGQDKKRMNEDENRVESKVQDESDLDSEEGKKGQIGSSASESRGEQEMRKVVYMREVPQNEKYEEYGSKDMGNFFGEYEKYCVANYGDNKRVRCGQVGHIASGCQGTRVNVVCGNCGKNGHYARMCKELHAKCVECGMEGHVNGCDKLRSECEIKNCKGEVRGIGNLGVCSGDMRK
ncbi:uncharacterized protein LOC135195536 [Macrobrachium nipponense]|uniref:uncharacterized protein LOC135195536 n=1 Tax=Macrobrachium nipponense TaxID=159736 RepID=UPI0030C81B27